MEEQTCKKLHFVVEVKEGTWTLLVDRSRGSKGCRLGIPIYSPHEDIIEQPVNCDFKATSDEIESEALIAGLTLSKKMSVKKIKVYSNSQLIMNQILREYQAQHNRMMKYLNVVIKLKPQFEEFFIAQVRRNENSHADALAILRSVAEFNTANSFRYLTS